MKKEKGIREKEGDEEDGLGEGMHREEGDEEEGRGIRKENKKENKKKSGEAASRFPALGF